MKIETLLLLIGTGLTVYMFLRSRAAAADSATSASTSSNVQVTAGNDAYDGVSIGRAYLDNLYRLAYASGANGP